MKSALLLSLLQMRLAILRVGIGRLLTWMLLILVAVTYSWIVPTLRARLESRQQAVHIARSALASSDQVSRRPQRTVTEERLMAFYDNLGERHYVEQQVKTLFAVAGKNNLSLNQAEYKSSHDVNGRFYAYQISLPVKGSYRAIRQFCEQVLLAIPFAALDDVHFKRETIGNQTLEAKLRFTLYLSAPAGQLAPASSLRNARDE